MRGTTNATHATHATQATDATHAKHQSADVMSAGGASAAKMSNAKTNVMEILAAADIQIGGSRPWDIQVKDESFYRRVLSDPPLELAFALCKTQMSSGTDADADTARRFERELHAALGV